MLKFNGSDSNHQQIEPHVACEEVPLMGQTWKKVVVGAVVEAAFCRWVAATKYKPKCNKNAFKKLIKSQLTTDWEKMLLLMLLQPFSPAN